MKAVILAGGRGTRLQPYTTVFPKPLMPIGDKPILDIVLRQLRYHGFTDVTLAVGYLAELLMAYFGDGTRLGVRVSYSREEQPLGTAGPIGLVAGLNEPFLAMNGDILSTLDFGALMRAHVDSHSLATMAVCRRSVRIDLGVIEFDDRQQLVRYLEKPSHEYWVSMGVYAFSPAVRAFIPHDRPLDLPDLLRALVASGERVQCFRFEGHWLDIGRFDDYQQAAETFAREATAFLPGGVE